MGGPLIFNLAHFFRVEVELDENYLPLISDRVRMNNPQQVIEDLKDPFRVNELTTTELKETPPLLIEQAYQLSFSAGKKVIRVVDANDALSDIFKKFLSSSSNHTLVVAEAGNLTPRSSLRNLFEN